MDIATSLVMSLLWGLNIIAVKIALTGLGPLTTATARLLVVLLLCVAWLKPVRGSTGTLILLGLNYGFIFALVSLSLSLAENVGALAIASQLSVPIAVILGVLFLDERPTAMQVAGILLALAGVSLMLFDPRIADDLPGLALMSLNAALLAVASLLQRRLGGVAVPNTLAWSGLMGSAILVPLALGVEPDGPVRLAHMRPGVAFALAFSALGSTLVAPACMAWLLQRHHVSIIMPLSLASTLVTVAAAHILLGTPVTVLMILGGGISLVGFLFIMRPVANLAKVTKAVMP
nr:DMT family transporter [Sphingomonas sp. Y57]